MKVIEQTSNHLILQTKPVGIVEFIVGLIFFGFPLLLGGALTVSTFTTGTKTLTCERVESSQINCKIEINQSSDISESSNLIPVTNLQEARVYPNATNNSNEVVLVTKAENVIFSNNIHHASLINKFVINKDRKYLRLPDVNYLSSKFFVPFFMGLIFSLFGLAGLLLVGYYSFAVTSYKFDKSQQILTLENPNFTLKKINQLTLIKTKLYEYPFSEILGFYFEKDTDSDGGTCYQVRLKLKEGKIIFSADADKYGRLLHKDKDIQRIIVDLIADYGIKGIFNLPNS